MIKKIALEVRTAVVDAVVPLLLALLLVYMASALVTAVAISIVFGSLLCLGMWFVEVCGGKDLLDRL